MADLACVCGADGCPAGWLGVTMPCGEPGAAQAAIVDRAEVLLAGAPRAVAIDIPIGLVDAPGQGPRPADRAARAFLSRYNSDGLAGVGSRVFPSPTRAHLALLRSGASYADLRARFPAGESLSKQCFNICPKIIELDDLMRALPTAPIWESHPEVAFAHNAGRTLAPKKSALGAAQRRALLTELGFDLDGLAATLPASRARWAPDDLLDACILAISATRIASGRSASLPEPWGQDSAGLPMAIFY